MAIYMEYLPHRHCDVLLRQISLNDCVLVFLFFTLDKFFTRDKCSYTYLCAIVVVIPERP